MLAFSFIKKKSKYTSFITMIVGAVLFLAPTLYVMNQEMVIENMPSTTASNLSQYFNYGGDYENTKFNDQKAYEFANAGRVVIDDDGTVDQVHIFSSNDFQIIDFLQQELGIDTRAVERDYIYSPLRTQAYMIDGGDYGLELYRNTYESGELHDYALIIFFDKEEFFERSKHLDEKGYL